MRPVFAVYSTFCQRAYDQFVHDTCIQENSVIFCLDRAGIAGEDGWTHHGLFDIGYMRCIPNVILLAPRDAEEFVRMFQFALDQTSKPIAIRYPKAYVPQLPISKDPVIRLGKAEIIKEGEGVALHAYGAMVEKAYEAALALEAEGIHATVVNARFAKPLDNEVLASLAKDHHTLITLEEHTHMGGFSSAVVEALADDEVELIVLATPNDVHAPQAIAALEAGKHVVTDKPMSLNGTEADAMIAAARASDRLLTVFQINMRIPGNAQTGTRKLSVTAGGVSSQDSLIPIQR